MEKPKEKVFVLFCRDMRENGKAYKLTLKNCIINIPQSWALAKTAKNDGFYITIKTFWFDKVLDNIRTAGGTEADMSFNPGILPLINNDDVVSNDPTERFVKSLQTDSEYWKRTIEQGHFEQVLVNLLKMHHSVMKAEEDKKNADEFNVIKKFSAKDMRVISSNATYGAKAVDNTDELDIMPF
jgi:hypothetical protein